MDLTLNPIIEAIDRKSLPTSFGDLFGETWSQERERFIIQENAVIDFKETCPEKLSQGYGLGLIRLAIAFYNSYGGLIVLGVQDRSYKITGLDQNIDIESFNRALSDFTSVPIECLVREYVIDIGNTHRRINAVLVPQRGFDFPTRLSRDVSEYKAGTLWLRERHEVIKAESRHLAFLYSARRIEEIETDAKFPVHRALPPSPATIQRFISRDELSVTLWDWFVFGDQPRLYLHGPGGSGKSTLAFEFARSIADNGYALQGGNGERIDYVIYISAKETELNTQTAKITQFSLQQFKDKSEQFLQIVYHSGLSQTAAFESSSPVSPSELTDLLDNFSGFIVIDDIDTLSRNGKDTGEEELFIKLICAKKRNRVLYTLRFPPSHAVSSSRAVPGLLFETEFFAFIEECCDQFNVPMPPSSDIPKIEDATSRLPLLIETVIALRKHCGNYAEALKIFKDKGGQEARRYLYQREYDRLDSGGKARHVLCALLLIEEPVSFRTLTNLFMFSPEQVSDALSEARSIFLSTFDSAEGETLYQLTPPAVPFIESISTSLFYYEQLSAAVGHFKNEGLRVSPEEASVIVSFERFIRQRRFDEIASAYEQITVHSALLANPKIKSLAAQAYSELGASYREKARELFKQAVGLGYIDVFMMRRWFNMELQSGYGLSEAEEVCDTVLKSSKSSPRAYSEFWSKKGSCQSMRATSIFSVNKDKAFLHLRESVDCYLEGLRIGRSVNELDSADSLRWMERPLSRLASASREDFDQFFLLIEQLAEKENDVDPEAADLILRYMGSLPIPTDPHSKRKLRGICTRVLSKINRALKSAPKKPTIQRIGESLEVLRSHFAN